MLGSLTKNYFFFLLAFFFFAGIFSVNDTIKSTYIKLKSEKRIFLENELCFLTNQLGSIYYFGRIKDPVIAIDTCSVIIFISCKDTSTTNNLEL